ncbi:MAG: hypothetical protein K0R41_295 [Geminicoccaceae bacterium]|jgi:hypothetical protein|nr:hypothetical protein [Geminicoccaceae bacterium]
MTRPSAHSPTALLLGLLAATLLAIALIAPARGQAAVVRCPNFTVVHDDRIGKVQLPHGAYKVKVLDDRRLTCPQASSLFKQFLKDFDGKLPDGWRVQERKGARRPTATFSQRGGASFRVKRAKRQSGGGGGGGGHYPSGAAVKCPVFHVLNNDLIAGVRFRKGTYQMTALGGVTCTKASSLFKRFLREAQESLPGRWRLKKASGKFLRGHRGKGFQVNLWS